jgi:aminoglycoside 3-N-acetyltransferase
MNKKNNININYYIKLIPQMLFIPFIHMVYKYILLIIKWENTKRNIGKKIYKKKYSTEDIITLMKNMGLQKGSNVFIHSSFYEFYNFKGTIKEFIDAIIEAIGETGTLAMPAFPILKKTDAIYDIEKTPTAAGMIAEIFRRYPGVKRSIDLDGSVCAIGPMSDYLLDEHKYSKVFWDEKSPYYKLSKINALVFSFGLGKYFNGSFRHCVEGVLKDEIPYFSRLFVKKAICRIILSDKSLYEKEYYLFSNDGLYRYKPQWYQEKIIKKYFDKSKYKRSKISNLTVNMYEADYCINRFIELGRKGIVYYLRPKPLKKYFKLK